ncbi:MAG: ATP-binding protein [Prochloron sp. SP5CPC1]|nr:ATP-binding protein [Candidatus Paraprochloron terpiosi SP5CPC1]
MNCIINLEETLLVKIEDGRLLYRRFRSSVVFSNDEISSWMDKWGETLQQFKRDKSSLMLRELDPYIFIPINRMSFDMMAKIWEDIQLTDKVAEEDKVLKALQIIEPKVLRIRFLNSEGQKMIRVRLQGENRFLPLNSMGEGINRLLGLALGAVVAENGVLLVDEIDTGLHYEVQTDMWRLIIKTAQELNIQVFATTHSWDCICALQEVLPDLEDDSVVKLFRLDAKYGKLRAVEYDAEGIDIVVQQSIEVR